MEKKSYRHWSLLLVAVLLAGGGIYWYLLQAEKRKPRFQTEKVERGTIVSTVNTTGTLNAVISVDIGSQVSGKVTDIFVDFNSHVRKGQMLAKMDPLIYKAKVDEANADLNSARATNANYRAQYENALSRVRAAQSSIMNSMAQLEIARANLTGAENNQKSSKAGLVKVEAQLENDRVEYKRAQELMKQDFISRTEMDAAETKYKVSLASVDVARAAFAQASSGVVSARMQLDAARANLESAKIEEQSQRALSKAIMAQVRQSEAQIMNTTSRLQEAMVNLGYTNIISPIEGVVVNRSVDIGQTVAASFQAPKLFTIAKDLRDMEVYANVDEADIGKVAKGMKATFTVDAFQGESFDGRVRQVRKSSIVDQGVVKYQVIISARNANLKLMPGMTANVIITSETKGDVLKVPNSALRFRPDSVPNFPYPKDRGDAKNGTGRRSGRGPGEKKEDQKASGGDAGQQATVWVLGEEGKVHPARIKTGITDGQHTEMKRGHLTEGQELIVGIQGAKPKPAAPRGGMRMFH